jgi:hypothetical protein
MIVAAILQQLWSGYVISTPQQNRKACVQSNRQNPLIFRGALPKQPGPLYIAILNVWREALFKN